jgi:hypothetical protein
MRPKVIKYITLSKYEKKNSLPCKNDRSVFILLWSVFLYLDLSFINSFFIRFRALNVAFLSLRHVGFLFLSNLIIAHPSRPSFVTLVALGLSFYASAMFALALCHLSYPDCCPSRLFDGRPYLTYQVALVGKSLSSIYPPGLLHIARNCK